MKTRTGFVSNSSSTSFTILVRDPVKTTTLHYLKDCVERSHNQKDAFESVVSSYLSDIESSVQNLESEIRSLKDVLKQLKGSEKILYCNTNGTRASKFYHVQKTSTIRKQMSEEIDLLKKNIEAKRVFLKRFPKDYEYIFCFNVDNWGRRTIESVLDSILEREKDSVFLLDKVYT